MGPAGVPYLGEDRGQAVRGDRVGVQVEEPVRQRGGVAQGVAVAVVLAEVPVQVPDVLAPARDLPDEALDAVEGRVARAVRLLGRLHTLGRVQEAEVQGYGEEAVAHHRVGRQHRVLVAAEAGQAVGDEVAECGTGLAPGGGEAPRAVPADEGDVAVALPAVEVAADLVVDVVLARPPGAPDVEGVLSPGRGFAVVVVQVPPSAGRVVAVHQQIVPLAHPVVEALQPEGLGLPAALLPLPAPLPLVPSRPLREVVVAHQEPLRGEDLDALQAAHEVQRPAGGGVADGQGARCPASAYLLQALRVRLGPDIGDPVAQLGCAVPHRREDQVRLRPVEAAPAQHRSRLDHDHRGLVVRATVARVEEVRAQLVPEQPVGAWCHGRGRLSRPVSGPVDPGSLRRCWQSPPACVRRHSVAYATLRPGSLAPFRPATAVGSRP
ncbi:hypothetical protein SCYAM73S_06788 [Streptomyces cyaneofuscatus]